MSSAEERALVLNVGMPNQVPLAERGETYSLRTAKPDYVVFVCSRPSPGQRSSLALVEQYAGLVGLAPEQFETLVLDDPDDLVAIYERTSELLQRLRRERPHARIQVDYTAGTKSMSAGLAMAAIDEKDERVELRLVRGQRGEFTTVIPGTELFRPVSRIHDLRARRSLGLVRAALERFDYAAAARWLDALLEREITPGMASQLQRARDLCRAFDAWDRWDLERAERLLGPYRPLQAGAQRAYERLAVLEQLRIVRDAFEGKAELATAKDPYVAVEDLLFNAKRRAAQGRYDDAVARVYRALELLAQIRLRAAYEVDTGSVDLARVPEAVKTELQRHPRRDGPLRVGLDWGWRILAAYERDPLGEWYRERGGRLRNWLNSRNSSILAHGLRPLDEAAWQSEGATGLELCREALARLTQSEQRRPMRHAQFPGSELLEESA